MERTVDGQTETAGRESVSVRSCPLDSTAAYAFLQAVDQPRFAWAEESTVTVAGGSAATITADGPGRFTAVREQVRALFDRLQTPDTMSENANPRLFGGFAFTETHRDPGSGSLWEGYPGAWFTLPEVQLTVTASGSWLTTAASGPKGPERAEATLEEYSKRAETLSTPDGQRTPGVSTQSYAPPLGDWQREIREATGEIEQGELRKVVLAQALTADLETPIDTGEILSRLGEAYPDCFRFLFEPTDGGAFFGATPERLVSVENQRVETEALAGSIGRGETTAEDEWLATQLLESEKNNHEHDIVVDTIRHQLDPLTETVDTGERTIRKLANVQHLQTPIQATLSEDRHVLDLVEALHPTPAVGGLPPARALKTIRETEVFDRGWYAAPIGWIDADGNGTFAVAIRSALARDRTATLFAGAGIVADSDPDEEWDELQLKYRPILDELT